MDKYVKTELDNIVGALADTGIVSQVILFGSHAKGKESSSSDIDLCVLTPVEDKHPIDIMVDLKTKLYGVKTMPLDLIAYNQDVFWYHAGRPTTFEHEIAETGVTIYGHR
jgi:predicted nucleotidyltransferase